MIGCCYRRIMVLSALLDVYISREKLRSFNEKYKGQLKRYNIHDFVEDFSDLFEGRIIISHNKQTFNISISNHSNGMKVFMIIRKNELSDLTVCRFLKMIADKYLECWSK